MRYVICEIIYQFTFSVDLLDVLGNNDPNMGGGILFGSSYNGAFLINATSSDYNEINIEITDSDYQPYIGQIRLGIYTILEDLEPPILRIIYSNISRPEEAAFYSDCEYIENNGLSSFTLYKQ